MTPLLELRGIVKRYGAATVLDGVDLTVAEQQVVTLIGASGSGKSTLLRCVDRGATRRRRSGGWPSSSRGSTSSRT